MPIVKLAPDVKVAPIGLVNMLNSAGTVLEVGTSQEQDGGVGLRVTSQGWRKPFGLLKQEAKEMHFEWV